MSGKTLATVGFFSMLAATLALNATDSFAADTQGKKESAASVSGKKAAGQKRVDIMETPSKSKGVQPDSMTPGAEGRRKDVVDGVGSKGDVYPSTGGGTRKDVVDEINQ